MDIMFDFDLDRFTIEDLINLKNTIKDGYRPLAAPVSYFYTIIYYILDEYIKYWYPRTFFEKYLLHRSIFTTNISLYEYREYFIKIMNVPYEELPVYIYDKVPDLNNDLYSNVINILVKWRISIRK